MLNSAAAFRPAAVVKPISRVSRGCLTVHHLKSVFSVRSQITFICSDQMKWKKNWEAMRSWATRRLFWHRETTTSKKIIVVASNVAKKKWHQLCGNHKLHDLSNVMSDSRPVMDKLFWYLENSHTLNFNLAIRVKRRWGVGLRTIYWNMHLWKQSITEYQEIKKCDRMKSYTGFSNYDMPTTSMASKIKKEIT